MTRLITKKWVLLCTLIAVSICCFQQNLSAQCEDGETGVDIIVDTTIGFNDDELGWSLIDDEGTVIASLDCETNASGENTVATTSACLVAGDTYTFEAYDTFGDGWGTDNTVTIVGNADGDFEGCVYVAAFTPNGLNAELPASAGALCVSESDGFPNEMEAQIDFIPGAFDNITLVSAFFENDGCSLSSAEVLTISAANLGCSPAVADGNAEVTVSITDGPNGPSGPFTESLPVIGEEDTISYDLTTTFDLSMPGAYTFDISVDFSVASEITDVVPENNGGEGEILSFGSFGSVDGESDAYVESFEADDGGWVVQDFSDPEGPSTMALGTPPVQTNINGASDGTQAWFHSGPGEVDGEIYNDDEAIFFLSGCFDMSCMETAEFSIDVNWDSETGFDGASIGFSTDGGGTFSQLGEGSDGTSGGNGTNWYNDPDIASHDIFGLTNAPGWSGDCDGTDTNCSAMMENAEDGWLTATHNIDFLAGEPSVIFAVVFTSDGSVQPGDGFAWDNVQVTGTSTSEDCFGCADVNACNFDGSIYDDGETCEYDSCTGCTDETACNYDAEATIDDESCDFSCLGCTDVNACNYDDTATIDDGSCNLGFCGDGVCDLDCGEDIDDCIDCSGTVTGCTDETACNFDAAANTDDNSCEYVSCAGCTDETACNYNADATIDDSSCIYGSCGNGVCEPICGETDANCADCAIVLGCTDPDAHNYRPRANTDNGNCMTCDDGIQNGTETGIDCGGTNPNCDACPPDGCTDATAHNYDPNAPNDDGSCMTCSDGIQNGDETGVDCGGTNPECGPCGDLCINALEIACGDVMSGNTGDYTTADGPGACGTTPGIGGGVWYTFVGTGETFRASLCNSDYDTKINVYSGDCDNLVCVDGNDDTFSGACGSTRSSIDIVSTVGTTYYIYVNGFSTNTGNYELTFDCFFPITITVNAILGVPANGAGTGSVSITVTGGNTDCPEGLFFDWEDEDDNFVADTEDLSGLTEAGTYNIYVDDCLGNSVEMDVVVPTRGRTRGRGRNGKAEVTETSQLIATPNPFATETMIGFQVGMEESVSLDVFDIRGAKVATLFDGMAEAGQNYQMSFGEGMPSGTYIAKLTTANGDVQHIKLVLTK